MDRMKQFLVLAALLGHVSAVPNMNGDYKMSKTPKGRDDVFPMRYEDYPGTVDYFDIYSPVLTSVYSQVMCGALFRARGVVWRFDSPFCPLPSQVIWTTFPAVPLPDEIVKRFAGGKPMAILGMESDQVHNNTGREYRTPYRTEHVHCGLPEYLRAGIVLPCVVPQVRNTTEGEVSVPITWTYNHHYGPKIIGENAKIIKVLTHARNARAHTHIVGRCACGRTKRGEQE